jgi:hypothetical protein
LVPDQARKIDNAQLCMQNLCHTCPTDSQIFVASISEVYASFKDGVSEIQNRYYGFPRIKHFQCTVKMSIYFLNFRGHLYKRVDSKVVRTMMCNTQNYCGLDLCPSSGILHV